MTELATIVPTNYIGGEWINAPPTSVDNYQLHEDVDFSEGA